MLVHKDWLLTAQRVAIHVPSATAVLADLHLGYHAARRQRGEAIPAVAVADSLAPLASVLQRYQLARIVIAGDLFEDGVDETILADLGIWLNQCGAKVIAVVPGNHDRRLGSCGTDLPVTVDGFCLHAWRVVHGDRDLPDGPAVFGHFHPAVRLGPYLRPCYLATANRLVLPAFSQDARGVNVGRLACWRGWRRLVPVGDEVLDFSDPVPPGRKAARCVTNSEHATNRGRSRSGRTTNDRRPSAG
jgi:uncharacterized protein